jgi:hypothetical protein
MGVALGASESERLRVTNSPRLRLLCTCIPQQQVQQRKQAGGLAATQDVMHTHTYKAFPTLTWHDTDGATRLCMFNCVKSTSLHDVQ